MPKIDFNNVTGVTSFVPLPDGDYVCKLTDIETDVTRAGDEMWKLRWTVDEGEHAGRLLFDNLVFSSKAMPRTKLVCEICGVDVTGEVNLEPAMILNKQARVTTYIEQYVDEHDALKARNRIPYEGYVALGSAGADCPF